MLSSEYSIALDNRKFAKLLGSLGNANTFQKYITYYSFVTDRRPKKMIHVIYDDDSFVNKILHFKNIKL
jgi:hypothetical protein